MDKEYLAPTSPGVIEYPAFQMGCYYKWLKDDIIRNREFDEDIKIQENEVMKILKIRNEFKRYYRLKRLTGDWPRYTVNKQELNERLVKGIVVKVVDPAMEKEISRDLTLSDQKEVMRLKSILDEITRAQLYNDQRTMNKIIDSLTERQKFFVKALANSNAFESYRSRAVALVVERIS